MKNEIKNIHHLKLTCFDLETETEFETIIDVVQLDNDELLCNNKKFSKGQFFEYLFEGFFEEYRYKVMSGIII